MSFLRSLSIQSRLWLQLMIVVFGIALLVIVSLSQFKNSLLDDKALNNRQLVDVAYSIVESYHAAVLEGTFSEEDAKAAALKQISALRYDGNNYFWVNDMHPRMVMHPFKPKLNGKDISGFKDPEGKLLFTEMVKVVREKGEGLVPYKWPLPGEDKPVDKISYVKGFAPWSWVIGSGIYLKDVDETFWNIAPTQLLIGCFILLLVASLSLLLGRSIVRPVNETVAVLNDIGAGEGDLTQRLDENGSDEISALSIAFNLFVKKIQSTLTHVSHATEALSNASDQLSSIVRDSQLNIEQQQRESQSAATAVTEMASTVNEIAVSAEAAAASARDANAEANLGKGIVQEACVSVNTLADEVNQAANVIDRVNADSQAISSVLDVIRGIAEQTNLLALNAAIEAARAGEQGRGFAVVADEVRTLAARTQQSTEEIRQMIESLQSGSMQAVTAMKNGEQTTTTTVEKASSAESSLNSIVSSVDTISDMNTQIASAAEEQTAVAHEIDQGIVRIAELSVQSLQDVEKTSNASQELAGLSESLKELVKHFKL